MENAKKGDNYRPVASNLYTELNYVTSSCHDTTQKAMVFLRRRNVLSLLYFLTHFIMLVQVMTFALPAYTKSVDGCTKKVL